MFWPSGYKRLLWSVGDMELANIKCLVFHGKQNFGCVPFIATLPKVNSNGLLIGIFPRKCYSFRYSAYLHCYTLAFETHVINLFFMFHLVLMA